MKFSINGKYKIWVVLTIAVLLIGFTLFGIFGFNQTVDYKDSFEAVVSMDTQLEVAPEKLEESSNTYFEALGLDYVSYATEKLNGPIGRYSLIYKFDSDVKLDTSAMQTYLTAKLGSESIVIEVDYNNVPNPYVNDGIGWALLAVGISMVAIFVYMFFMEKVAGAVSVLASSVLAALLFVALLGATRIPANPFALASCLGSAMLSAILSAGLVNRFKEETRLNKAKTTNADKLSYVEIADKGAKDSLLRFCFVAGAIVLSSALMIAIGSAYIKFLGLQVLVAGATAIFSSLVGVPLLWPVLKNIKK
jgi:preprotein translocase subunit SecF